MSKEDIKKIISKLPDTPGVYFFKRGKDILYIGKATSLRDRVRSYFSGNIGETRGPLISKMLGNFDDIIFQKTDSVLEALVLEANLIKKYQPEANIKDKDNRSFNYVVITKDPPASQARALRAGDFPRVLIVRGRDLEANKNSYDIIRKFGPFPNGSQLKAAMKIVRRMFPYRDKCTPFHDRPLAQRSLGGVGCFNRQIGLCPGVCTGEISKEDYRKQIKNLVLFFEGNKKKLIKNLEKQMKDFAKERDFENADKVKRQMFSLYHIQDVSLLKDYRGESSRGFRIESYDIAHLSGTNVVGVMTVVEEGEVKKSDYRKFKIKNDPGVNDTKALSEIISRRIAHIEWPEANLIVVDGGVAQKNAAEKVLSEKGISIPVVSVVKDERHKPKEILGVGGWLKYEREILLSNAEAHRFAIGFHKYLRGKLP